MVSPLMPLFQRCAVVLWWTFLFEAIVVSSGVMVDACDLESSKPLPRSPRLEIARRHFSATEVRHIATDGIGIICYRQSVGMYDTTSDC